MSKGICRVSECCLVCLLAAVSFQLGGCTHEMELTNVSQFQVAQQSTSAEQAFDLAISSGSYGGEQVRFYDALVEGLRKHPQVRHLRTDWTADMTEVGFEPRYLIGVEIEPEFKGDGANFLTTWPGCYIFACAWDGYKYHCNTVTRVNVTPLDGLALAEYADSGESETGRTEAIEADFDFKHCDFDRGFWSGTGWWFPGWGVHNIVTGIFFTDYEKKATAPFHAAADPVYGDYVANEIIKACCAKREAGEPVVKEDVQEPQLQQVVLD